MALPIRMSMMRVVIEQLSTDDTVVDSDFREQKGPKVRSTRLELEGQVNLYSNKRYNPTDRTATGDRESSRGRIYFRVADLQRNKVTLRKGDMLIEVGPEDNPTELNCPLIQVRPESPWRGQFLLMCAEFEFDREERESIR
jgi:hypothetical protein